MDSVGTVSYTHLDVYKRQVFISSLLREIEENYKLAKLRFHSKKIYLFDAETISYEVS